MKICSVSALSDIDLQNLRELSGLCQKHDHISLSFPLEGEEADQQSQYYLMYEDSILVSALVRTFLAGIGYECIALTRPGYRRQGRFYTLLTKAAEDLPEEEPLVLLADGTGECGFRVSEALACDYWFSEYLMALTPGQFEPDPGLKTAAGLTLENTTCSRSDGISTYQLRLSTDAIGSCYLASHQKAHYLYGFEIQPEYRNRGYGRAFLFLLCRQLYSSESELSGNQKSMPLLLQVNSLNEGACHLYQTFGFRITEEIRYYLW